MIELFYSFTNSFQLYSAGLRFWQHQWHKVLRIQQLS